MIIDDAPAQREPDSGARVKLFVMKPLEDLDDLLRIRDVEADAIVCNPDVVVCGKWQQLTDAFSRLIL